MYGERNMEIKKQIKLWNNFRKIFLLLFGLSTFIAAITLYSVWFIASFMSLIMLCTSLIQLKLEQIHYDIRRAKCSTKKR